jgi:glycosyltransferase involved in cell wall biosynthesis
VGEGGLGLQNCEAELRDVVAKQELGKSVTFTGSVDNVEDYLRASDCFVFPTEREAFGISAIEAMACGLTVIATAVGGLADVVRADAAAIVVPARDGVALESAIERVLRDSSEVLAMGSRARDRAVAEYSEQMIVAQYKNLLTNLVEGHREVQSSK